MAPQPGRAQSEKRNRSGIRKDRDMKEKNIGYIQLSVGEAAIYEQLAEEAAELSQAALKCARIIRRENPTPVTQEEADRHLQEEFSDVMLCTEVLGLKEDPEITERKAKRWVERLLL